MNDDDLTRGLEGWAAATDPDEDPITVAEATAVDAVAVPAPGGRRWLAVAAAVLVLLGVAAAVVAVRSGDDPAVTTDEGEGSGPRTQIVVDAPDLSTSWWIVPSRLVLWGPCPGAVEDCAVGDPALARPLAAGTSLVVDEPLAPGRWLLRLETRDCGSMCGAPRPDGTSERDELGAQTHCDLAVDVAAGSNRIVVENGGAGGLATEGTCGLVAGDRPIELTVPPAWSTRPELPWSCGAATFFVDSRLSGDDPEGAAATLDCFRRAVADGTPVEIPVAEARSEDEVTRSWWRVLPEPEDGHPIEVIRDHGLDGVTGWARLLCDDIDAETSEAGGGTFTTYVGADLVGCTEEEAMDLDLPPLDPPPLDVTVPPPGTTPPEAGTIDVVLDADDLPMFIEGGTRRWSILVDGQEVAAGPLTETGSSNLDDVGRPDLLQVGDDVPAPDGAAVTVRVDDYDCFVTTHCRADGAGPVPGATAYSGCPADAPAERGGSVLVVTLRAETCTAAWAEAPPALTVPPDWSLRPTGDGCGAVDLGDRWAQCLVDALQAGETAEYTRSYDGLRVTYAVVDGAVRVYRHTGGTDPASVTWTVQDCTGAEPDPALEIEPLGCGPEEDLDLAPR